MVNLFPTSNKKVRGYVHIRSGWTTTIKHFRDNSYLDVRAPVGRNTAVYTREGLIWVANNWWIYRLCYEHNGVFRRISPDSSNTIPGLVFSDSSGVWHLAAKTQLFAERISRTQLAIEELWNSTESE